MADPEVVIDTPEALARVFADRFAAAAAAAVAARGRFACALPGGSVAEAFLPVLAHAPVAWGGVDLFWGDERAVAPEHPDSNYGLAKRLLLDALRGARPRLHRMVAEANDLDTAARAYEAELVRVLGEPPRLDLVVLGVGPDGHVCSLFPGHPLLHDATRLVAPIEDAPKPPKRRLTMTLRLLAQARLLCVAGFGAAKAEAIRAAVDDAQPRLPVTLALRAAGHAVVLVDRDAGSDLRSA